MDVILGYLSSYGYILVVFAISFVATKVGLVKEEGARKIIHILVCFTWIIMEKTFNNRIHAVVIPVTFVFINLLAMKKQMIPGMYREKNDTYGTVFYAISLAVMNLIAFFNDSFILPAGIAIFALSFGDGFAAIIGGIEHECNKTIKHGKSIFGTTACLIFSFIGVWLICFLLKANISIAWIIVLAFISTVLEFIGGKYDNLLIPFGVFAVSYIITL